MSAISFARQAFSREKPHSSITDWVEILTSSNYEEEAYDGIPELVDAINLQGAGPTEASRAIRKKLKHGNPHQQYRAMVILKALVENCGHKFLTTFADGHLTDALKLLTTDSATDTRVRRKILLVLASWEHQYQSDPDMSQVAGLYKQCRNNQKVSQQNLERLNQSMGLPSLDKEEIRRRKKEMKEQERREKEEKRLREREKGGTGAHRKRQPFDFETEKPQVLASIVEASQATSNLINAITLVNPEKDRIQKNERVQDCLVKAKQARKPVVRYIQLVENEELIGTLIETNERIMGALEMYEQLCTMIEEPEEVGAISTGLAATYLTPTSPQNGKGSEVQNRAVRDSGDPKALHVHPDLQDLSFGPLGASSNDLPAPLRPSPTHDAYGNDDDEPYDARGSLSDFSDYQSSNEETHNAGTSTSKRRDYVNVSDDPDDDAAVGIRNKNGKIEEDPFADPFADEVAIGPSRR